MFSQFNAITNDRRCHQPKEWTIVNETSLRKTNLMFLKIVADFSTIVSVTEKKNPVFLQDCC